MEGLTQTEIAKRLGFSTAKVNRLLLQAREQGYVNITIRTPFQQLFDLEDRLKAVFGLQDAIVIPAVAESGSSPLNALGAVGGEFLLAHLHDGDVLAITPARPSTLLSSRLKPRALTRSSSYRSLERSRVRLNPT